MHATALAGLAYAAAPRGAGLDLRVILPAVAVCLFCLCMYCHGELVFRKPAGRYLTQYYLFISLGCAIGALGGGPIRAVRALSANFGGKPICTRIGGGKTAPDDAALHNGALKFDALAARFSTASQRKEIVDAVQRLDRIPVRELVRLLARVRPPAGRARSAGWPRSRR